MFDVGLLISANHSSPYLFLLGNLININFRNYMFDSYFSNGLLYLLHFTQKNHRLIFNCVLKERVTNILLVDTFVYALA